MKRYNFFRKAVITCVIFFLTITAVAQNQENVDNTMVKKWSLDPKVRFGRLDNNFTYYIRRNETQKGQADFYLTLNVGSMQEEDHQRGYMFFLEHLALKSSKNFPSKSGIKGYIEKNGLKTELITGFDETMYKLKDVPVLRQDIIDSCLLILHDWTSFLFLEDDAIEEQRTAIREKVRQGQTPQIRILEQQLPVMYPKSKYGARLPNGIIGIIENVPKSTLEEFYKKWYSTNFQTIVVVGDIDVDKMEEKIKKIFSDIPKAKNTEPKELYLVADNDFPIISVVKEEEEKNTTLTFYYKHDNLPFMFKGTIADFITNYSKEVIAQVMKERLENLLSKPDNPFIAAAASDQDYFISKTKGAWTSTCIVKPNKLKDAIKSLLFETKQIRENGITEQEYERAKTNIVKYYESASNNKNIMSNAYLANRYANHFINDDYMPGIEEEYEIVKQVITTMQTDYINNFIKNIFKEYNYSKNVVITLTAPGKEDNICPTVDELIDLYINACDEIEGVNNEDVNNIILISEMPSPGNIVTEIEDTLFGATIYTLSNGINVVVKQTDLNPNQILMTAISPGGTSMFKEDKDNWNINFINAAINVSGLGELNASKLKKFIDFNKIKYNAGLTPSSETITGETTPSNLKTLLEIIYLQFTDIRSDNDAFISYKESYKTQLDNLQSKSETIFKDSLNSVIYGKNPRANRLLSSDFDKIEYNRLIEMYKERFADASDFTFTFTGDINKEEIRPLLEQYLATLPSLNQKDKADENQIIPFQKGHILNHFAIKSTEPVSNILLMYTGKMTYNLKNLIIAQNLNNLLEMICLEKLGQYYGYSVLEPFIYIDLYDFPMGRTSIQIFVDASPEKQDEVIQTIKEELKRLAEEGPVDELLMINKNSILRKRKELLQQNDYWLNIMSAYYSDNFDAHTEYESILKNLTKEDIKSFTKELLNQGNVIEVVMFPE